MQYQVEVASVTVAAAEAVVHHVVAEELVEAVEEDVEAAPVVPRVERR